MYRASISEGLEKHFRKLKRKDPNRHRAVLRKIEEIVTSDSAERYKNLSYSMKRYKEVHIDTHFVLIFVVEGDCVIFEDLQHHDDVFRR